MNWSRIKSILIIVLLVVNLLLGGRVLHNRMRFVDQKKQALEAVQTLYEQKRIRVDVKALQFSDVLPSMDMQFETYDERTVSDFLGRTFTSEKDSYTSAQGTVFLDKTQLVFTNSGAVSRFQRFQPEQLAGYTPIRDSEAVDTLDQMSRAYLEAHGLSTLSMHTACFERQGERLVYARQFHEGYLLRESETFLWFEGDTCVALKRCHGVKQVSTSGGKYDIIPIDRVLYALLPELSGRDAVNRVEIVYKLNDASLLISDLVEGEAMPYYHVELSSGLQYDIRAVETQ